MSPPDSAAASAPPPDDGQSFRAAPGTTYYKIRLASGRVLGPLDLERIKLFVAKNKISGNEVARLYPSGTWRDINHFPEIAELILQHIEGRLTVEKGVAAEPEVVAEPVERAEPIVRTSQRSTRSIQKEPEHASDEEGTVVISRDDERTMMLDRSVEVSAPASIEPAPFDEDAIPEMDFSKPSREVAQEKTVMLSVPPKGAGGKAGKRLISHKFMGPIVALVALIFILDMLNTPGKPKAVNDIPFRVAFPEVDKSKNDPQTSELTYKSALSFYTLDTVDGYKRAAMIFMKAVTMNSSNIKAMSLLASCYINLIDVVEQDEKYFQVIGGLVEAAKNKQADLVEVAIVEVEFFNMLSNVDAAIARIIELSKLQLSGSAQFPTELYYYLAMSYFNKGSYAESIKALDQIPVEQWFSAKIPYLYGLIFEKNGQLDQAVVAFEKAIQKSNNHVKARSHLAEVMLRKGDMAGAGSHADFIVSNKHLASRRELAMAYYIRGKMRGSVSRNEEALADLDVARKLQPENTDILLEYYTVRARVAKVSVDTQKLAKVFDLMAQGEEAFRAGNLPTAMKLYMDARNLDGQNAQPLLRIAAIFKEQNNPLNAMTYYEKAVALAPTREDLYPPYIKFAINSYEFETARKAIDRFTGLTPQPPAALIDYLNGFYYYKKEQWREAQVYFKRALQASSMEPSVYVHYADILYRAALYKEASFFFGLARRFDPLNFKAIAGMAKSMAEGEGIEKAQIFISNEMEKGLSKAPYYVVLAEILLKKNNASQALKEADKALESDPKYALGHRAKGDALQALEQWKAADDVYQTYLSMAPDDPLPRIERYRIAMKRLDFVQASKVVNDLIRAFPRYPGGHYMLGEIALQAQNPKEALREAELELKNNPSHVYALILAGNALNMGRDYLEAMKRLNAALALDPASVPALVGAGYSNHMLKSYAAAQTMLERAMKLDPGYPEVRKRLGSVYFDMGQRKEAAQQFKAYLDLYPDAPDRVEIEKLIQ